MRELLLKWEGVEYRCKVTHDLIMMIENKVVLQDLANRFVAGCDTGAFPTSHIAWLYYCVLKGSGAPVTSEMVWDSIRSNKADSESLMNVINFLISEVFGAGPESEEGIEQEKKQ